MNRMRAVSLRAAALVPLVLVAGCSAAPPTAGSVPPPHPAPPPRREEPKAPEPPPWVEILDYQGVTSVIGHAPDGGVSYTVQVRDPRSVVVAPDGGACLIADREERRPSPWRPEPRLMCLDARGRVAWETPTSYGGASRLVLAVKRLLVFDLQDSETSSRGDALYLTVYDAATGERVGGVELPKKSTDAALNGDFLAVVGGEQVALRTLDGKVLWSIRARMFPTTEPSERESVYYQRKVAVRADGTVLAGAADGSLLAFDRDGKPLYQLGVRGPVSRIEARPDGDFVVRSAGRATVIGPGGVVRREVADSAEPSPPTGVIDHRIHPLRPSFRTTHDYRIERAGPPGKPFENVTSVAALAPNDVWAIDGLYDKARLYHFDGRAWKDAGAAEVKFPREVYLGGMPAAASSLGAPRLARGPHGKLQVLGLRRGDAGTRVCVTEYRGGKLHERTDLRALLEKTPPSGSSIPTYAVSPAGHEVLCGAAPTGCVETGPGISPRSLPHDQGEVMPGVSPTPDRDVAPLLFVGETLWKVTGAATADGDLFALTRDNLLYRRDRDVQTLATPFDRLRSVWATSKNDVWLTDRASSLARFDGSRWWRILDARGEVTGSGPEDVWVFDGPLWHITPDPRKMPDLEAVAAVAPPPSPPSAELRIAGADPSYRLERVVIDVAGTRPLRTATGVVKGPGGVLWFHEGSRVIEYDGARTRVIHEAPKPEPFHCWAAPEADCNLCSDCTLRLPQTSECYQCAAPTAAGEGAMLVDRAWQWASATSGPSPSQRASRGGVTKPGEAQISRVLAIAASPTGAVWAVSADQEQLPGVLLQSPSGRRFLTGLPPAAYTAMALRADDDAWLAGGLTTVWSSGTVTARVGGEGTLVHFDGHTFTRSRAPDGALLSVAAVGPNEAWAVGQGGGVLHRKGDVSTPFHLEREDGSRLRVFLRGVAVEGPGDVFIAGESSVLVRWDGSVLRRVDTTAAGRDAAFSAVVAPSGTKSGWVVGPTGIWKVVRVPQPG